MVLPNGPLGNSLRFSGLSRATKQVPCGCSFLNFSLFFLFFSAASASSDKFLSLAISVFSSDGRTFEGAETGPVAEGQYVRSKA